LAFSELAGSTGYLFKNIDDLLELTLFLSSSKEVVAGSVLRSLNEYKIRKACGDVIYRVGLQVYSYDGVSEKTFADNSLFGRMDVGRKGSGSWEIKSIQLSITLETKNSRSIRMFGDCQCTQVSEGCICPHMAALMIAWVREPRGFKENFEYLKSKFEKAKQDASASLEELLDFIETGTSAETLGLLEGTYSKIRQWSDAIKEVNKDDRALRAGAKNFDPLRELSGTINYVSLSIISAIGDKYKLRALDLYNKSTLTSLGKVLELFVENTSYENKSVAPPSVKGRKALRNKASQQTARTWDQLLENFAKGA
jgi:hypothetical protein